MIDLKAIRPSQTVVDQIILLINSTASRYGVPSNIITGMVEQESQFDSTAYRFNHDNPADRSYGLMQLTIPTASDMAGYPVTSTELYNPNFNLDLRIKYFKYQLDRYNNVSDAIAAYNAGSVRKSSVGTYINMDYVMNVISNASKYPVAAGFIGLVIIGLLLGALYMIIQRKK